MSIEEAIRKAKHRVIKRYSHNNEKLYKDTLEREWLDCHVDSYNETRNRVTLTGCEGSPVKGYLIINYGNHTVTAFDAWGEKVYTYKYLR